MTYSEIKTELDDLATTVVGLRKQADAAKASLTSIVGSLNNLPTIYGDMVTAIDEAVASEPSNAAAINSKAEKDYLAAEFLSLKAQAEAALAEL